MNYTKETAEVLIEIGAGIYGLTLLTLMYLWEKRKEKKMEWKEAYAYKFKKEKDQEKKTTFIIKRSKKNDKHKQNTRNNTK